MKNVSIATSEELAAWPVCACLLWTITAAFLIAALLFLLKPFPAMADFNSSLNESSFSVSSESEGSASSEWIDPCAEVGGNAYGACFTVDSHYRLEDDDETLTKTHMEIFCTDQSCADCDWYLNGGKLGYATSEGIFFLITKVFFVEGEFCEESVSSISSSFSSSSVDENSYSSDGSSY